MHSIARPPKQEEKPEKVFEIRDLTGKVIETRPTYWTGLLRGYILAGCGKFTVEAQRACDHLKSE